MFTRQHYIAHAKIVKGLPSRQRKATANKFARMFAKDNPRFDRKRFMDACGVK